MASNPIEAQMWAAIDKHGGMERILERIANGETMKDVADTFGVSRSFLSWKLNAQPGMREKLIAARQGRADKWAEETLEIADNAKEDPNAINKAKMKIDTRKWLAGVDDPERYAAKQQQVNISIGGLHLDALRKVQSDLARPVNRVIEGEAKDVTGD